MTVETQRITDPQTNKLSCITVEWDEKHPRRRIFLTTFLLMLFSAVSVGLFYLKEACHPNDVVEVLSVTFIFECCLLCIALLFKGFRRIKYKRSLAIHADGALYTHYGLPYNKKKIRKAVVIAWLIFLMCPFILMAFVVMHSPVVYDKASKFDVVFPALITILLFLVILMSFVYLWRKGFRPVAKGGWMKIQFDDVAEVSEGKAAEWVGGKAWGTVIMLLLKDSTPVFLSNTNFAQWGVAPVLAALRNAFTEMKPYIKASAQKQGVKMAVGGATVGLSSLED